ncbi:IucA/IucC family protein [Kribbella sp. NPDC056345]|uniref:IucA/IucC family protein n=1 Tax=Kribbella sp. NPDC056345 TaxID=3345789 RepID=UPI0035DCB251
MTTIDDLIGFGLDAYRSYAPDPDAPVWLAARRDRASCAVLAETIPAAQLAPDSQAEFAATLAERGLDVAEFHLIAVHPRQWANRLATRCAGELAKRNLVLLGASA